MRLKLYFTKKKPEKKQLARINVELFVCFLSAQSLLLHNCLQQGFNFFVICLNGATFQPTFTCDSYKKKLNPFYSDDSLIELKYRRDCSYQGEALNVSTAY